MTNDNYEINVLENLIDNLRSDLNKLVSDNDKAEFNDNIIHTSQVLDKLIVEYIEKTSPYIRRTRVYQIKSNMLLKQID